MPVPPLKASGPSAALEMYFMITAGVVPLVRYAWIHAAVISMVPATRPVSKIAFRNPEEDVAVETCSINFFFMKVNRIVFRVLPHSTGFLKSVLPEWFDELIR